MSENRYITTNMVLSYAFCNVAVSPLRVEPNHRAEMVNQLLFGEKAEILEINDDEWARVHCAIDDYIGWCKISQLTIINKKDYQKEVRYLCNTHQGRLLFDDREQWTPLGCNIFGLRQLHEPSVRFKGKKIATKELLLSPDNLIAAAIQYTNTPYLWGGRTIAGIDCSGLTQMTFKLCGKNILRDASQQATQGEEVSFLQHAKKGDLAFFENENGQINHVGLLVDSNNIIHATDTSGKVVIDKIDQGGIISNRLRKRTHTLRVIKRHC